MLHDKRPTESEIVNKCHVIDVYFTKLNQHGRVPQEGPFHFFDVLNGRITFIIIGDTSFFVKVKF